MPELPDVVVYVESLDRLLSGQRIENVRVRSPFVLKDDWPKSLDDLESSTESLNQDAGIAA